MKYIILITCTLLCGCGDYTALPGAPEIHVREGWEAEFKIIVNQDGSRTITTHGGNSVIHLPPLKETKVEK